MNTRAARIFPSVAAVIALACTTISNAPQAREMHTTRHSDLYVVLLGTGTPSPDPERSGSSVAVVSNKTAYVVDAGPGVVRRAAAAARNGDPALEVQKLGTVFITHLHSDHTLGLPDLILTGWGEDRNEPLEVYGPQGLRKMVDHLLAAYDEDIQVRLGGWEADTPPHGYKVNVHEIGPGQIYRNDDLVVTAYPVPHVNWKYSFAYRFESGGRSIVISGDTRPSDGVVAACSGCDILVHGVYSAEGIASGPEAWKRYFAAAHTSTAELADIARRARPKLLVLYHQMYWGKTDGELEAEIRRRWPGKVVSATDLAVYAAGE